MFSLSSFFWNQGIVYCTCGQFLVESESRIKFNKLRLDALSIPHCVIKKGRCHGARHGKTEEQKEYHIAWNARKRCCEKVDSHGGHFTGIHDRFLRDPVYRESQFAIGWTEQKCKEMDELAKENHTYHLSTEEFKKIPRTMVSHPEHVRQKWACETSTRFSSCCVSQKPSPPRVRRKQNPFLHNNTGDGILLQALRGGTRLNGIGSEHIRNF